MINLLATNRKAEIRAARTNLIITRYIVMILLAFAFISGVLYVSYSVLLITMNNTMALIAANDAKAGIYSETRKQVETLGGQLSGASAALAQEVKYSSFLVKLGQLMPSGTLLGEVKLDSSHFNGTPLELKAYAKSANDASTLQNQFQSSPLFSSVTPQSTNGGQGIDGYPVSVSLTVTINKAGI